MKHSPRRILTALTLICVAILLVHASGCARNPPPAGRAAAVDSYVQGVLAYHAGDKDKAIADLQKAVRQHADLVMAHEMLGNLYQDKQKYDDALTQYEISARLDPYSFKNHYNEGLMEQLLGHVKEAIDAYLRSLKLNPTDFLTTQNLGAAYFQLDDYDNALTYCRKATELDEKSAPAWSNLALAMEAKNLWKDAETSWRKVLELDNTSADAGASLAKNLTHQERYADARGVLSEVVHASDTAPNHKLLGDALSREKKYDEALDEYARAIGIDPKYAPAFNEQGWVLITQYKQSLGLDESKRTGALDAWRKSLALNPNQAAVRTLLKTYAEKMVEPTK